MTARIDTTIEFRRTQSAGPAIVYVLPHRGEEFLKLGFSRDPLQRMQDLHRRYFDFFDVDRMILIETSSVAEARRIETNLKRAIIDHRAPSPLDTRHQAGGETEWYRGAYAVLEERAKTMERDGFVVHWHSRNWITTQLIRRRDHLFEWTSVQFRLLDIAGITSQHGRRIASVLRDVLDANAYFEIDIADAVPMDVAKWYVQLPHR
jgi:hypothetical protein